MRIAVLPGPKNAIHDSVPLRSEDGWTKKKTPSLLFVRTTKSTLARETPRHSRRRRLGLLVLVLFKEKRAFCAHTQKEESRPFFFFF